VNAVLQNDAHHFALSQKIKDDYSVKNEEEKIYDDVAQTSENIDEFVELDTLHQAFSIIKNK